MKELNDLLQELGISKVRLAKYLGVSRQMVYNYLELDSIDKWPAEKKILLYKLFGIEDSLDNTESLSEINVTTDFILQVEERLSDGIKDKKDNEYLDLKGLKKEEHNLVTELTLLIKDKLGEENNQENFYLMQYIYNMLQVVDKQPEIKYMLAYLSKLNCQIPVDTFKFDEEEQYIFEGIIHSAFTLFGNRGKASRSRIEESRNRLVEDVQEKKEEILSRTQQLTTVKFQALKELGYDSLTPENAVEVYEKISEITTKYNK